MEEILKTLHDNMSRYMESGQGSVKSILVETQKGIKDSPELSDDQKSSLTKFLEHEKNASFLIEPHDNHLLTNYKDANKTEWTISVKDNSGDELLKRVDDKFHKVLNVSDEERDILKQDMERLKKGMENGADPYKEIGAAQENIMNDSRLSPRTKEVYGRVCNDISDLQEGGVARAIEGVEEELGDLDQKMSKNNTVVVEENLKITQGNNPKESNPEFCKAFEKIESLGKDGNFSVQDIQEILDCGKGMKGISLRIIGGGDDVSIELEDKSNNWAVFKPKVSEPDVPSR